MIEVVTILIFIMVWILLYCGVSFDHYMALKKLHKKNDLFWRGVQEEYNKQIKGIRQRG